MVCCHDTTDPVVCTRHSGDSVYCQECVARLWIESGHQQAHCEHSGCSKQISDTRLRMALARYDDKHRTHYVANFDRYQTFRHGDPELPTDGLEKRVCACHSPQYKGTVSKNREWILFQPSVKVSQVCFNPTQHRFQILSSRANIKHPPVCVHCRFPHPTPSTFDVNVPCMRCNGGEENMPPFSRAHHYVPPHTGARDTWQLPVWMHTVSLWDLEQYLYHLLEDPELHVRCPIDGTLLEHGSDCHELTCPTCNIVKACYCCGRFECVGPDGAMLDHFAGLEHGQCCRYPFQYSWSIKSGDEVATIEFLCTSQCTSLRNRCDMPAHQTWHMYYKWWRRTCWVHEFICDLSFIQSAYLCAKLKQHPRFFQNPFKAKWTLLIETTHNE